MKGHELTTKIIEKVTSFEGTGAELKRDIHHMIYNGDYAKGDVMYALEQIACYLCLEIEDKAKDNTQNSTQEKPRITKARGPKLALEIVGELEKYPKPLSQEQTEGIIQQVLIKGGYTDDDLREAMEIIAVYMATEGSREPDAESEPEKPQGPVIN